MKKVSNIVINLLLIGLVFSVLRMDYYIVKYGATLNNSWNRWSEMRETSEADSSPVGVRIRRRGTDDWSPFSVIAAPGDIVEIQTTLTNQTRVEGAEVQGQYSVGLIPLSHNAEWIDDETLVITESYRCSLKALFLALRGYSCLKYDVMDNETFLGRVVIIHPLHGIVMVANTEKSIWHLVLIAHALIAIIGVIKLRYAQLALQARIPEMLSTIIAIKP